jgi:hypothetical protein
MIISLAFLAPRLVSAAVEAACPAASTSSGHEILRDWSRQFEPLGLNPQQ